MNRLLHILRIGVCLVLVASSLLCAVSCKTTPPVPSPTPTQQQLTQIHGVAIDAAGVAVRTDHYTVTRGMLAYYFYDLGLEIMRQMEAKKPYDSTRSLKDQLFTEQESWYAVMMRAVLDHVCNVLVLCEGATAAGNTTLPESTLSEIEERLTSIRFQAAAGGKDLTAWLQQIYGPHITQEDLREVLCMEALAAQFAVVQNKALENGISSEQAQAFAAEHGLTDTTPSRCISFLQVKGESETVRAENASAARAVLASSPSHATMESLSAYGTPAAERNMIPENAGVAEIRDWLFAKERSLGDIGIVTAQGTTYLLLYTENGIAKNEVQARMQLFDAAYAEWYNALVGKLNFGYNYDVIDSYDVAK